jgi:ornithine lipid ester-linked acyl 2-hydroxylase
MTELTLDALHRFEDVIKARDGAATFFDTARFDWVPAVQSDWRRISGELDRILAALDLLPGFEDIQVEQRDLTNDKRWKIYPLFVYGQWMARSQQRCPATVQALQKIPGLQAAMFSILQAGKELPEHRGPYAGVLRYHLGLKIPQPESLCGIAVGGDVRHWSQGQSLVFDDSHPHSAWNRSGEDRVVLFVDFSRPLPSPLRDDNQRIIDAISAADFMVNAANNWRAWEARHGDTLDQLLAAA